MQEAPQVPEPQVTPMTPKRAEAEKVDLEKDAEASRKTTETEKELSPEAERTNSYQCYVMSGKGDTPEQKVNEAIKELNYHNMLVVIAVGDKTINNIGSIYMVAEKWGLLYSIIQRVISGIKEHHQGGRQYDKILIFEPQRKIKLSRSMYKVNSYIDFKLYKETFKQFGHYMRRKRF